MKSRRFGLAELADKDSSFVFPEIMFSSRLSRLNEGRFANVTIREMGCGGRGGIAGRAMSQSGRRSCVVLTPQGWRQAWRYRIGPKGTNARKRRWQQCMAHRGERVISRKAIAQGMPDVLRCPVCSCAHFFYPLRMRPRVQRASGIPCALWIERTQEFQQTSGAMRREKVASYSVSSSRKRGPSIPETPLTNREAAAYWIPAFAGMTRRGWPGQARP